MPLSYETKRHTKAFGWRDDLKLFAQVPFFLLATWGAFIFLAQLVVWMETAVWIPVPLLALFTSPEVPLPKLNPLHLVPFETFHSDWLQKPEHSLGLHKIIAGILNFIPLPLFIIITVSWAWYRAKLAMGLEP